MILEKAKINGGYDQIVQGKLKISLNYFLDINVILFIRNQDNNKVFDAVKKNENTFGTLSLCGCYYYNVQDKYIQKESKTFIKEDCNTQKKIKKSG